MKAEHFTQPDCHIGITREIEIDLKRKSNSGHPTQNDSFLVHIGSYFHKR